MKSGFLLVSFICVLNLSMVSAQEKADTIVLDLSNDSTEYQLIIIDIGFESWLVTQKPISFYSNEHYRMWNLRYASEWNSLYNTGRYPEYVESYVDYRAGVDYGVDLNYKLYYYFKYFEEKNKITLIKRGRKL